VATPSILLRLLASTRCSLTAIVDDADGKGGDMNRQRARTRRLEAERLRAVVRVARAGALAVALLGGAAVAASMLFGTHP
jgi:hypothetical protein